MSTIRERRPSLIVVSPQGGCRAVDRIKTDEVLAFKHFEARAAARRDMAELGCETELLYCGGGVPAANDRHPTTLGRLDCRLCDRSGARIKRRHFENTHRTVPNHCVTGANCFAESRDGCRSDVEPHPSFVDALCADLPRAVRVEGRRAMMIHRKHDLAASLRREREKFPRFLDEPILDS